VDGSLQLVSTTHLTQSFYVTAAAALERFATLVPHVPALNRLAVFYCRSAPARGALTLNRCRS
jgi:hypothetical protein